MPLDRVAVIAEELALRPGQVEATLRLQSDGATVPFIARYRKEATGGLDEVAIGRILERGEYLAELEARRETVLASIAEQGKLTPDLRAAIDATLSKTELEDLYLPFKPKRRTRATIAKERGLAPLAQQILAQERGLPSRERLAAPHLGPEVADVAAAFAGARDIVAESIAELAPLRAALREQAMASGLLQAKVVKGKEAEGAKFQDYFSFEQPARELPSHRLLALRRGEKEGFLRLALVVEPLLALDLVRHHVVRDPGADLARDLEAALVDAYDRLLTPAIEVDVRLLLKEQADREAIRVFAENLRHLLLASPLGGKRVLALDPGLRTGCKVVVLDEQGALLANEVVFLSQSEARAAEAAVRLTALAASHRVEAVAVGNGTGGREAEGFLRQLAGAGKLGQARVVVVSEAGASVYSASEIAREELPDQDVTVRGAVSIGRRLQDPLAELVKIDPKSIGVGQYQHDVHQATLAKALDGVVESCVSGVGVDVNTASVKLLQYVSGVGPQLAKNILAYRGEKGRFRSRRQLLEVPRFGPKAFEQAAGFLRIQGGENPLDRSAVHPESYDVVSRMAKDLGVGVSELIGRRDLVDRIDIPRYVDERRGEPTLRDILDELRKPGRDPRSSFDPVAFRADVTAFEHLAEGMILDGVVTNVTQFGAFVDVGVHQDGLVHVSELSHRFVKDAASAVKVGDRVKVKVIKVDAPRRRIGLSIKQASAPPTAGPRSERPSERPPAGRDQPRGGSGGPAAPPRPPSGPGPGRPSPPFNGIRIRPR